MKTQPACLLKKRKETVYAQLQLPLLIYVLYGVTLTLTAQTFFDLGRLDHLV